jgi:hypothetical protein
VTDGVWSPLSDTDPVPGEPWKVNELGSHLVEQAEKIRDMVTALKKVQADDTKSVAIEGIVKKRDDVIPDLNLLAERYETSGNAIRVYGDVLDRAQELATQAQKDSWDAQRRISAAQQAIAAANPTVISAPGAVIAAPVAPVGPVMGPDHEEELRQAKADLDKAERLLDEAKEMRDHAAGKAREQLDDANHDDLKNPNRSFFSPVTSAFDHIKNLPKTAAILTGAGLAIATKVANDPIGAFRDVTVGVAKWTAESFTNLDKFSDHLGLIGGALGIAALFFPPTGLIATAIAVTGFAISATKLGVDSYLAATGRASWGDVAVGAIGMAAFGAARVAAEAQRATALKDTMEEATRLRNLNDVGGLDMAGRLDLSRAEKVVRTLEKQEAAKNALNPIIRWANVIREPAAPAENLLEFSSGAQKIARVNTVAEAYKSVDEPLGRLGAVNDWADELKPIAKDYAP